MKGKEEKRREGKGKIEMRYKAKLIKGENMVQVFAQEKNQDKVRPVRTITSFKCTRDAKVWMSTFNAAQYIVSPAYNEKAHNERLDLCLLRVRAQVNGDALELEHLREASFHVWQAFFQEQARADGISPDDMR